MPQLTSCSYFSWYFLKVLTFVVSVMIVTLGSWNCLPFWDTCTTRLNVPFSLCINPHCFFFFFFLLVWYKCLNSHSRIYCVTFNPRLLHFSSNPGPRDASLQAKAWIQALAIYFQAICFSFFVYKLNNLDSFQAHSCFLTGNPAVPLFCRKLSLIFIASFPLSSLYGRGQEALSII